jgi:hypothetical protein
MPVILATQEAEIRKITVQGQTRQIVCETPSQKNLLQKRKEGEQQRERERERENEEEGGGGEELKGVLAL